MLKKVESSKISVIALAISLALPVVSNADITVDGEIGDWFTSTPNLDGANLSGTAQFTADVEKDGVAGNFVGASGYLGSGSGGQAYDAEGIFIDLINDTLYIAIVTGLAPDANWFAGDIFLDTDTDDEYEYALVVDGDGDKHENVVKSWNTGSSFNPNTGDLFSVAATDYGLWEAPGVNDNSLGLTDFEKDHPTTVSETNSGKIGKIKPSAPRLTTELSYAKLAGDIDGGSSDTHYLIEASIDLSAKDETNDDNYKNVAINAAKDIYQALTSTDGLNLHWAPTCNNDYIVANASFNEPNSRNGDTVDVAEPTSLALLGLGFIGMIGAKRRKKV